MIRDIMKAFFCGLFLIQGNLDAQDVMSVGPKGCVQVPEGSRIATVPIFLRDVGTTRLSRNNDAANRIDGFSFELVPTPVSSIALKPSGKLSVHARRAGVTASVAPINEGNNSTAGSTSYYVLFDPSVDPLPLVVDRAAPGDHVAELVVNLAPGLASGSRIDLRPEVNGRGTRLSNRAGTVAESAVDGMLLVHSGCIEIVPAEGGAR